MKIDKSAYNAIMFNATRAYEREGWLIDAIEEIETRTEQPATGEQIANHIEGLFAPYCDRLIEKATDIPEGQEEAARTVFFRKFTGLVA